MVGTVRTNPTIDNLCKQPDMVSRYMCIMNDGLSPDRTYNNEYLLAERDPITVFGKTYETTLRPDIALYSQYTSNTVMSSVTALAEVYLDYFICSEDTCNNYVDLKYVKNGTTTGVGFMVGAIPVTEFALSTPLRGSSSGVVTESGNTTRNDYVTSVVKAVYPTTQVSNEKGYAVLDTRVNFEAYFDSLYKKPSFGIASVTINNTCTLVLYPRNSWYQENIMTNFTTSCSQAKRAFALMGVATNNWCRYCDESSINVVNNHAPCYPSNTESCNNFIKNDVITQQINTWDIRLVNITKPTTTDDLFYGQDTDTRSWGTILMEIIAEARRTVPAGCTLDDPLHKTTCIVGNCSLAPYDCVQVDKTIHGNKDGYDELSKILKNTWVASWQTNTFSMLGYERVSIENLQPQIHAAEEWGYQIAKSAVTNPTVPYSSLYSVSGYIVTFAISIAATIGAWFAYADISKWISKHSKKDENSIIGKLAAGALTMIITVLPFTIIVITDYSVGQSNNKSTIYMQQAFDAPGYGHYKLVVVAQIDERSKRSFLPLEMGIPFAFAVVAIGIIAIKLAKFMKDGTKTPLNDTLPS